MFRSASGGIDTQRKMLRSMIVTLYWEKDTASFLRPEGKILLLLLAAAERMCQGASVQDPPSLTHQTLFIPEHEAACFSLSSRKP